MSWASANKLKNSNESYNTSDIIEAVSQHFDTSEAILYTILLTTRVQYIKKITFYLLYAHSKWDFREISKHFRCNNFLVSCAVNDMEPENQDIKEIRRLIKQKLS